MSYEQLASILAECAQEAADSARGTLEACPRDGEPLDLGRDGQLHCRFCGSVYPAGCTVAAGWGTV